VCASKGAKRTDLRRRHDVLLPQAPQEPGAQHALLGRLLQRQPNHDDGDFLHTAVEIIVGPKQPNLVVQAQVYFFDDGDELFKVGVGHVLVHSGPHRLVMRGVKALGLFGGMPF
jgi:hypothetical protein